MADIYLRGVPSDSSGADVRLYDPTQADAGGGTVTGTLGVTLAVLLLAGTGTVSVSGSGTPSLAALTASSAGAVAVSGSSAPTLGQLTLVGTGTSGGGEDPGGEPGQYFESLYYGSRPAGSYRLKGGFFWKVV